MLCLSLEHQDASDVDHALRISEQYDKRPVIHGYNLYLTCYGVYRGTTAPEEKLQIYSAEPEIVKLPWNNNSQRVFVEWPSPQWEKYEDRLCAPLTVVAVCEKVFTLAKGVETHIITQGEGASATANVIITYADADCLDMNLTRYL